MFALWLRSFPLLTLALSHSYFLYSLLLKLYFNFLSLFVILLSGHFIFYHLFLLSHLLSPLKRWALKERTSATLSLSAGFCGGYYHMIISDGQLASKMFHYERARWDLISTPGIRAAARAGSAQGNYISITRAGVNKATLKECEGAAAKKRQISNLQECQRCSIHINK